MPMIDPDQIEKIRNANDVVDVIKGYINVRRAGATFKALCPFHKEKTPSFTINPQRQIYHCFGCGAGGNVISFIMAHERVDFVTAVKMLAQRAGITIKTDVASTRGGPPKDLLFEINEKAASFYQEQLLNVSVGAPALKYLKDRAISREVIDQFRIGFAPDRWDSIVRWADGRYSVKLLETSGLIVKSEKTPDSDHYYDRFRGRLMFPVCDEQGRVTGFSGRVLSAGDTGGKYVNTPETPLFHKGRLLYAMDKARRSITDTGEAVICEGQIDVIRCHIAGVTSAVAAQGTAFTDDHARIIKRYADGVIIVFDSDTAGKNSALRAASVFAQAGLAARIVALPQGQDPDSFIIKNGVDAFRSLLENACSALDFQIDILAEQYDFSTELGLLRSISPVIEIIRHAGGPVHRAKLLQRAAERLGIPEDAIGRELNLRKNPAPPPPQSEPPSAPRVKRPARELALLEHVMAEPSLISLVQSYLPIEMMESEGCKKMLDIIIKAGADNVVSVVSGEYSEDLELLDLVSAVLSAPSKIKSSFASHEESVKSLILSLRIEALKRRRKQLLDEMKKIGDGPLSTELDKRKKTIESDYFQMGYDIAKHGNWDEALPVMEIT